MVQIVDHTMIGLFFDHWNTGQFHYSDPHCFGDFGFIWIWNTGRPKCWTALYLNDPNPLIVVKWSIWKPYRPTILALFTKMSGFLNVSGIQMYGIRIPTVFRNYEFTVRLFRPLENCEKICNRQKESFWGWSSIQEFDSLSGNYKGNLNTGLVRYSNGGNMLDHWMVS